MISRRQALIAGGAGAAVVASSATVVGVATHEAPEPPAPPSTDGKGHTVWRNWSGIQHSYPAARAAPVSEEELVDVLKTAGEVFPYSFRYVNFVLASDWDLRKLTDAEGRKNLMGVKKDGKPLFSAANAKDKGFINLTMKTDLVTLEKDEDSMGRAGEVITDWNMIPEFRHGKGFPAPCPK